MINMHALLLKDDEDDDEDDDDNDIHDDETNETVITADATSQETPDLHTEITTQTHPPIFRVNDVADGSPASAAGIQVGDEILQFGIYDASNRILPFPQYVQNLENTPTKLTIHRNSEIITLTLTPSVWSGRGLLGCQIIPL